MTEGYSDADHPSALGSAPAPSREHELRVLTVGMTWLPEQSANGLDKGYFEHVRHLPAAGVRVRGLVAGSTDVEHESGGIVRAFASGGDPLPTRLLAARRVAREELVRFRPHVVVTHFALHAAPMVDLLRVPMVVHFHGPWAAESAAEGASAISSAVKRAFEKRVYRRAALFVVLSEAFKSILVDSFGVDPSRVRLVPGGVDIEEFDTSVTREEARLRLGWPAGRPIVLSVRRLMRRMGLEGLIEAIGQVRERHPNVLLLIAGRGPIADELQRQIDAAGLEGNARLLGFVPDAELPLAYRAADLTVMPTVALEGFGLPTVESLASGTPVVVTPQGGLPEVVRDLDSGLVCDDTTPEALARRIESALDGSVPLPSEEACREYARAGFSWPAIARRLADVYREANQIQRSDS
jgi:glycosyltransferase involved in cell wall biosynthesis